MLHNFMPANMVIFPRVVRRLVSGRESIFRHHESAGVPTVAIGEGKEAPYQWSLTDSPEGLSLIFALLRRYPGGGTKARPWHLNTMDTNGKWAVPVPSLPPERLLGLGMRIQARACDLRRERLLCAARASRQTDAHHVMRRAGTGACHAPRHPPHADISSKVHRGEVCLATPRHAGWAGWRVNAGSD
jgi:hypothetical protein